MTYPYEEIVAWLRYKGVPVATPVGRQAVRSCSDPDSADYGTSSWHCDSRGARACDLGLSANGHDTLRRAARLLARYATGHAAIIRELFYWDTETGERWFYDEGVQMSPSTSLAHGHRDHIHVAIWEGRHLPKGLFVHLTEAEEQEILEAVRAVNRRTNRWDNPPSDEVPKGGILRRIETVVNAVAKKVGV